jgi:uncharacterized membrane protein
MPSTGHRAFKPKFVELTLAGVNVVSDRYCPDRAASLCQVSTSAALAGPGAGAGVGDGAGALDPDPDDPLPLHATTPHAAIVNSDRFSSMDRDGHPRIRAAWHKPLSSVILRARSADRMDARMLILIIGLIAFLGLHSLRVVAEPWRAGKVAALGEMRWRGLYSIGSIVGLGLIVWGFALARKTTPVVWTPPLALHYVTALLVLVSFVLLAAAYVPGTTIKAVTGHPMTLGIKTWALAHLLSAGTLADILLFGSFLVWAVLVYRAARRRDRAAGTPRATGALSRDALAALIGVVAWVAFAGRLHEWMIGVRPFG